MALFSTNITLKFQADVDETTFKTTVAPGTSLNSLFRGELAILANDQGIGLYTLNGEGEVVKILPAFEELADIDIQNPQPGEVLIYNGVPPFPQETAYPDRPSEKWINVPAPRPNLSGNSIFEMRDVDYNSGYQNIEGTTLVWDPVDPENLTPGEPTGYWRFGKGVTNSILNDFGDVRVDSSPIEGQTLVWNISEGAWVNDFYPEGLNDLKDVDLDTIEPLDGDVLLYDGSTEKWVPGVVTGGNANVEIITDESQLPVAPLGTLAVSEEVTQGDGGDFYWIQEDNTDNWAKGVQAGQVTFGDFKDIDTTGIKEGQALRWTYTEDGFKFLPTDLPSLPHQRLIYPKQEEPFEPADETWWTYRGRGMALSTSGEANAHGYTNHNLMPDDGENSPMLLGMYGVSPTQPLGIHVDRSEVDLNFVFDSGGIFGGGVDRLDDDFNEGFLKFPSDLQADEFGLWGIRPVSPAGSVPWDSRMATNDCTWVIRFWLRNVTAPCVLLDYGTFKIEVTGIQTFKTKWTFNGVEYERDWNLVEPMPTDEWFQVSFGADYKDSWFGNPNPNFPDARYTSKVRLNVDYRDALTTLGEPYVEYDTELEYLTAPDVSNTALPVWFEGFTGDVGAAHFAIDNVIEVGEYLQKGQWPEGTLPITTMQAGQLVQVRDAQRQDEGRPRVIRMSTFSYDPDSFGRIDPGMGFTAFGSNTDITNLADFDRTGIDDNDGYLFWDSTLGKFKVITETPTWVLPDYRLTEAEDVRTRNPYTNERLSDGQVLSWDSSLGRFIPTSTNLSLRINNAEDVDVSGGIEQNNLLVWDAASEKWIPGRVDGIGAPTLDALADVEAGPDVVADNYTLLYSEALGLWYAAPAPSAGVDKLSDMRDVNDTGIQDGQVLAWDNANQVYVPSDTLVPTSIDDLSDVETSDRPPRQGQSLQWNGYKWVPGNLLAGGASSIRDLYDVEINNESLQPGQGLTWSGQYWENRPVAAGVGDGGDWETGATLVCFTSGVWGGGDFDNDTSDLPVEQLGGALFRGGGDFF